jgi:hypothetical protein
MAFIQNFLIPLVKVTFILGIVGYTGYYVWKGFNNAWSKSWKFSLRYKLPFKKKPYPESIVKWILDCMEQGIGYYDAKKILMVKMFPDDQINETMWIYDQIIIELNKEKGNDKNKFKGVKNVEQELPRM